MRGSQPHTVEIRKLTMHVNDRQVNILAPIKGPKIPKSQEKAMKTQAAISTLTKTLSKREREEQKEQAERLRLEAISQFYTGAKQKLDSIYADIKMHPELQVSGLKNAHTRFKIPRIKRNKVPLADLLEACIEHNKHHDNLTRNLKIQNKITAEKQLFKFEFLDKKDPDTHE